MRLLRAIGIACIASAPCMGQTYFPGSTGDASAALAKAQQALTAAQTAQASADASVKSVNGFNGVVSLTIPTAPDLSAYAKTSALAAYVPNSALANYATTATLASSLVPYATTSSVSSAITAATPSPCGIPLPDTLIGTAGTGSVCMPRVDASRPTVIQAVTTVTASDGTFAGNWPAAFASTPTGRLATIEVTSASAAPYKCDFISGGVTASGFSGKCWQIVATTLPTTATALLGLVVSPIQNAAAGLTVRIVGRQ